MTGSRIHHVQPAAAIWLARWVLFAASCNIAGWILSAFSQLYLPGLLILTPATWWILVRLCLVDTPRQPLAALLLRWRRRKRGWLPLGYASIVLLALIGGLLYAPNNYDAMNYRLPKVAHWLTAGGWEWIPANNNSLNTRSSGIEWMIAPMIALTRTDRLIFLFNFVSFLFLPGLVFGLLRGLGASGKSAWSWMWLFPSGYCFALQAGSVGNDLPAAVFALAAFDFGLRWRRSGAYANFALALASAGMMTAIKPTTLPLLLPFACLFFRMLRPVVIHPVKSLILIPLFALASFLPTAAINHWKCGDWTGAAAENPVYGSVDPASGLLGNLINAPLQNLAPPVFPFAKPWNAWFAGLFPDTLFERLSRCYEPRAARLAVTDIQGEESAGIGLGIALVFGISILSAIFQFNCKATKGTPRGIPPGFLFLIFGTSLLVYFSRTGMNTVARHIAPYYVLLFAPLLLSPVHSQIVATRWWKFTAGLAVLSSLFMLVITPSRPLWPAGRFFAMLPQDSASPLLARAREGYFVYADRSDVLGALRDALPESARLVGCINHASGPEIPLWKPYLKRRIRHIRPTDDVNGLVKTGMRHVILNTKDFERHQRISPEAWLAAHQGTVIFRTFVRPLVKEPPSEWWAVELNG